MQQGLPPEEALLVLAQLIVAQISHLRQAEAGQAGGQRHAHVVETLRALDRHQEAPPLLRGGRLEDTTGTGRH